MDDCQESLELQQRQAELARQVQLETAAARLRAAQPAAHHDQEELTQVGQGLVAELEFVHFQPLQEKSIKSCVIKC